VVVVIAVVIVVAVAVVVVGTCSLLWLPATVVWLDCFFSHCIITAGSADSATGVKILIPYKMKIWHRIYFGSLANYENPPN